MNTYTCWLIKSRNVYFLVIDEAGTKVIRDLHYVLKEWLASGDPFEFTVDESRDVITIRLSSTEGVVVNLWELADWYMEHRVKVGLRHLIVDDLKEATDED